MRISLRISRTFGGISLFVLHEVGLMKSWAPWGWLGSVQSLGLRDVDSGDEPHLLESLFALLPQLGTFVKNHCSGRLSEHGHLGVCDTAAHVCQSQMWARANLLPEQGQPHSLG